MPLFPWSFIIKRLLAKTQRRREMIIMSVFFFAPLRLREKKFYLFGRLWPETVCRVI